MSRYFSPKFSSLVPYVPGEQPKHREFIKLNTNESPFPPSEKAVRAAAEVAKSLHLYSDPTCAALVKEGAKRFGVSEDEIIFTNGSDESLNFAFAAFCDAEHPAVFPDITYGFYPVFARYNGVPFEEIPLRDDFTVDVEKFIGVGKTVFLANPNAPTGIALPLSEVERIVRSNPGNVVVIDEAYIDFGGESALTLIPKYENLLVVRTFSKSRSMAGARLGFAMGNRALIQDLNTLRFSTNPYNVNAMTIAAGVGALSDEDYTRKNIRTVVENRAFTEAGLTKLGFSVLSSSANFVFVKHERAGGEEIYRKLREKGVLVRHFTLEKIKDYNRITIGTREQMETLLLKIKEILEESHENC